MNFERESVQEIWRTPQCTFNVVYPTSCTVCIKGMRGEMSREEFVAVVGIFARSGFDKLLYERIDDYGNFIEKIIDIKDKHINHLGVLTNKVELI